MDRRLVALDLFFQLLSKQAIAFGAFFLLQDFSPSLLFLSHMFAFRSLCDGKENQYNSYQENPPPFPLNIQLIVSKPPITKFSIPFLRERHYSIFFYLYF